MELIVLARKPLDGTVAANVLRYGTGALNINGCRIEGQKGWCDSKQYNPGYLAGGSKSTAEYQDNSQNPSKTLGRWPANVCLEDSDEVVALFPQNRPGCKSPSDAACESIYRPGQGKYNKQGAIYADDGSAARFFFSAKAGKQDRWGSKHPTVKPIDIMKWLVALVTPPGGTVLDPFAGSGTTGVAALATGRNAILIEREPAYIADTRERLAFYEGGGSHSVQAKNRNRPVDHGPLFSEATE